MWIAAMGSTLPVLAHGREAEREADAFGRRETVTDRSQAAGAAEFTEAADGLVTRRVKEENPDGTWDNVLQKDQETETLSARVRTTRDGEETATETLHRSQTAAANLPAEEEGTIDELSVEKTKGKWYDNRLVRRVARVILGAERRIVKDVFETVEEGLDKNLPTADKPGEISEPSDGVWYEQLFRRALSMRWNVGLTKHTEKHVPVARYAQVRTPLLSRVRTEARNSPVGDSLGTTEYGSMDLEKTRGGRWSGGKDLVTDTLGAVAATEYESNYLESRQERQEIVATEGAAGAALVGRTLTQLAFRRTDGGNWLKTTVVSTVPEARQWTLLNQSVMGQLFERPVLMSKQKMVLFLNADLAAVSSAIQDFLTSLVPFSIHPGDDPIYAPYPPVINAGWTIYYFSYATSISNGLRPDKFGTWSGQLSMSSDLVNKQQYTVASTS